MCRPGVAEADPATIIASPTPGAPDLVHGGPVLDGTFRFDFDDAHQTVDGRPTGGSGGIDTSWFAFRSQCSTAMDDRAEPPPTVLITGVQDHPVPDGHQAQVPIPDGWVQVLASYRGSSPRPSWSPTRGPRSRLGTNSGRARAGLARQLRRPNQSSLIQRPQWLLLPQGM